jgi:hypothetical protein
MRDTVLAQKYDRELEWLANYTQGMAEIRFRSPNAILFEETAKQWHLIWAIQFDVASS